MKFIKLLTSGFKTQLNLPSKFCKTARRDFSAEAVVVTRLGRWMIKVGNEKGRFHFHGNEWIRFVNEHELKEYGFMLFEHHGSFVFNASIYGVCACEKLEFQPISGVTSDDEAKPQQCDTNPTAPLRRCANPTFKRILSACSGCDVKSKDISCLYLPIKIWKPNNLQQKTEARLRISGVETTEWEAKLAYYPDHAYGRDRLLVKRGWYEFVKANKINKGRNCAFEIIMDASKFGSYAQNVIIIIVTK